MSVLCKSVSIKVCSTYVGMYVFLYKCTQVQKDVCMRVFIHITTFYVCMYLQQSIPSLTWDFVTRFLNFLVPVSLTTQVLPFQQFDTA